MTWMSTEAPSGIQLAGAGHGSTKSAGAAMMSDPMIGSGDSVAALEHGLVDHDAEGEGVWIRGGMGFLAGALTDQHFLARGRLGRLLAVLDARQDVRLAYGVDENTAIVVRGDHAAVVGASGVVVVDMRPARRDGTGQGFRNARMFLLGDGDRFLPGSGEAVPSVAKAPVPAADPESTPPPPVPTEPWIDDAFARFLVPFAPYPAPGAILPAGRFVVRLSKPDGFRVLARPGRGAYRGPDALFAGPLTLDLVPKDSPDAKPPAPAEPPEPKGPKRRPRTG